MTKPSIGGDLARKPSGFETLVRAVVETRRTFVLPDAANVLLIVAGIAIPLVVLFPSRRKSLRCPSTVTSLPTVGSRSPG